MLLKQRHLPQRAPAGAGRAPAAADPDGLPARLAGRQPAREARAALRRHGRPAAGLVGKPQGGARRAGARSLVAAQPGRMAEGGPRQVRALLNELAFEAHAAQPDLVGTADMPQAALVDGLMRLTNNPDVKPGAAGGVSARPGRPAAAARGRACTPSRTAPSRNTWRPAT